MNPYEAPQSETDPDALFIVGFSLGVSVSVLIGCAIRLLIG